MNKDLNIIAIISFMLLSLLYITIIFAGFISPYDPKEDEFRTYFYHPPKFLHFIDQDWHWHLRPFVYPIFIADRTKNIYSEGKPLCVTINDQKYNEEEFFIESITSLQHPPVLIKDSKDRLIGIISLLTETDADSGTFAGCYPASPYEFKKNQTYKIEYKDTSNNTLLHTL